MVSNIDRVFDFSRVAPLESPICRSGRLFFTMVDDGQHSFMAQISKDYRKDMQSMAIAPGVFKGGHAKLHVNAPSWSRSHTYVTHIAPLAGVHRTMVNQVAMKCL